MHRLIGDFYAEITEYIYFLYNSLEKGAKMFVYYDEIGKSLDKTAGI